MTFIPSNPNSFENPKDPLKDTSPLEGYCLCGLEYGKHLNESPIPPTIVTGRESVTIAPVITKLVTTNLHETHVEFRYDGNIGDVNRFFVSISYQSDGENPIFMTSERYTKDVVKFEYVDNNTFASPKISFKELGMSQNDFNRSLYFKVWAIDYNNSPGPATISHAIRINTNAPLGLPHYAMNVEYVSRALNSDGKSTLSTPAVFPSNMATFVNRVLPIIKDVFGPPSKSSTVKFVKDASFTGSNIYYSYQHAIHGSFEKLNARLVVHELLHAWKGKTIITTDGNWNYDPKLSGFEESIAEGVAYIVMNKYHEQYQDDLLEDIQVYDSRTGSEYELRNIKTLSTENFWSDSNGMGLASERYSLGAAAVIKMWVEDENVFKNFNAAYFNYFNTYITETPSRDLISWLFKGVLPTVEGKPIQNWINEQRVFDCRNRIEDKVLINRYIYWHTNEYVSRNRISYYETFPNGSDWFMLKPEYVGEDLTGIPANESFLFHNKNGATFNIRILNHRDEEVWVSGPIRSKPLKNPTGKQGEEWYFASIYLDITSADLNSSFLSDPTQNEGHYEGTTHRVVLQIPQTGRYTIEVTVGGLTKRFYRVLGHELAGFNGVYGLINGLQNGRIEMTHSKVSGTVVVDVNDHVFYTTGDTGFTSITNTNVTNNKKESIPGVVEIKLYNANDKYLGSTKRNIGYGDYNGNQFFFLKKSDFELNSGNMA